MPSHPDIILTYQATKDALMTNLIIIIINPLFSVSELGNSGTSSGYSGLFIRPQLRKRRVRAAVAKLYVIIIWLSTLSSHCSVEAQ